MITLPSGVRVYLACGYTDMRKGMATSGDAGAADAGGMIHSLERSMPSADAAVD